MKFHSIEDLKNEKYSFFELLKDTSKLLKPYKWRFGFATFLRLLSDLVDLYPVFALASVVTFLTNYTAGDSLDFVWTILGLWVLAYTFRAVSQYFCQYMGFSIAAQVASDSNIKTLEHMFHLDMAWHEKENSGNKIKRIQNGGEGFNKIIRIWFEDIVGLVVSLVGVSIIISQFDGQVLFLLVIFIFSYFTISFFITRRAGQAYYEVNKQEEKVSGIMFEAIGNIKTVKVMSMGQHLISITSGLMAELIEKIKIRIRWFQFRGSILNFFIYSFRVGIILLVVYGIINGRYEIGFLVLFDGYFLKIRMSAEKLSNATQEFVNSKFSIARMKEILNEPVTIDNEEGKVHLPKDWKKISVKNLSFSYGDNQVLSNISFEVNRGEKVGIVGLSGAGKSTLFKLLLKEREEFSGEILFDNLSIKNISKMDYFNQVSVVMQDTEVFNFTLRDNITITNNGQKENNKLLGQALKTAHISEFLNKLPKGLDTLIGEKGVKLSGGERQRLGIARAIFKQPEVLLLDEATSHLDLESEEDIKDSLHKFFENVTAIVIAHRLTTIREMDKIIVIEDGTIIESGNFETLYASKGRFHELWEKQGL